MSNPVVASLTIMATIMAVVGVAAGIAIGLLQSRSDRATAVRLEDESVWVGNDRIVVASIARIDVAPLYDVAPADDLWIIRGDADRHLSFFSKAPGAKAVLLA